MACSTLLFTVPAAHAAGVNSTSRHSAKVAAKPAAKTAAKTAAKSTAKSAAKSAKPRHKPVSKRPAAKQAAPAVTAAALPAADNSAPAAELDPAQAELASRVLLGDAACEFGQTVHVAAVPQRPGQFRLTLGKTSYTLVPQATSTGAVRLEDAQAGVVWLQIPTKSMLLDDRIGQRLVDDCKTEEQRVAVVDPANRLGIAPAEDGPPAAAADAASAPAASAVSLPSLEPQRGS